MSVPKTGLKSNTFDVLNFTSSEIETLAERLKLLGSYLVSDSIAFFRETA